MTAKAFLKLSCSPKPFILFLTPRNQARKIVQPRGPAFPKPSPSLEALVYSLTKATPCGLEAESPQPNQAEAGC